MIVRPLQAQIGGLDVTIQLVEGTDRDRQLLVSVGQHQWLLVVCEEEEPGSEPGLAVRGSPPSPVASQPHPVAVQSRQRLDFRVLTPQQRLETLVSSAHTLHAGGGLSPRSRLQRAYDLGLSDQDSVAAARRHQVVRQRRSEPLPGLRSYWYAVLNGLSGERVLTADYREYERATQYRGGFGCLTVSRGFPTLWEARAYFAGANEEEPEITPR